MTIGSLEWAQRNGGNLTNRERLQLLLPILGTTVRYAVGRVRLRLGWRARTSNVDLYTLKLPDSRMAKLAEQACHETLSPALVNHSYRTYLYALILANVDGVIYDPEHLYMTCLLHDIALEDPQPGRCFAVRGADVVAAVAAEAAVPEAVQAALCESVCMHITPGVGYERDVLATLMNAAALVDIVGMRLWDFPKESVEQSQRLYPRLGFKQTIIDAWRAEAKAVPGGRAAWVERAALFSIFARLAPYES